MGNNTAGVGNNPGILGVTFRICRKTNPPERLALAAASPRQRGGNIQQMYVLRSSPCKTWSNVFLLLFPQIPTTFPSSTNPPEQRC